MDPALHLSPTSSSIAYFSTTTFYCVSITDLPFGQVAHLLNGYNLSNILLNW